MKNCRVCGVDKPLSEYYGHKARKDGLQTACKPCANAASKRHYDQEKPAYLERQRKRTASFLEFVRTAKTEAACMDCGVRYPDEPWLMDFDHRDGSQKAYTLSATASLPSLKTIKVEIAKCDIVCAICHRRRTASRAGWSWSSNVDELVGAGGVGTEGHTTGAVEPGATG